MEKLKNNKEFIISFVSCIVLVLALCYFGVNNYVSDTYAATTCYCPNGYLEKNGVCIKETTHTESGYEKKHVLKEGWQALVYILGILFMFVNV